MKIPYENLEAINISYKEEFLKSTEKFREKGWFVLGEEVARF